MRERRSHQRQRLDARVRLYHPVHGTLDGRIRDLSSGGMFVLLEEVPDIHPGNGDGRFQCKPMNMDAIFDMACIRLTEEGLALTFCEPAGAGETLH